MKLSYHMITTKNCRQSYWMPIIIFINKEKKNNDQCVMCVILWCNSVTNKMRMNAQENNRAEGMKRAIKYWSAQKRVNWSITSWKQVFSIINSFHRTRYRIFISNEWRVEHHYVWGSLPYVRFFCAILFGIFKIVAQHTMREREG